MARLLSVNVGFPRDIVWKGRTVHTGVWKNPVTGRCRVGRLNLEGDGQGDLTGHGGEHRAVFVYQIESYRYWREQLKRSDFVYGQFGENFTIEGLAGDARVHRRSISDRGPTKVGTRPPSTWRIVQSEIAAKDLLLLAVGAALPRRRFHECDRRWRQRAF